MPITRKPLLIVSLSLSLALGTSTALAQGCGATDRCPTDGSAAMPYSAPFAFIANATRIATEMCALPLRMGQWLLPATAPGATSAPRPGVE